MRPPGWQPRLIALDIDGTVVHGQRPPSPRVVAAVRELARTRHVTLCTGRTVLGIGAVLDALDLGGPGHTTVCSNGAVTVETSSRRVLAAAGMRPARIVETFRRVLPGVVVGTEDVGVGQRVSAPFPGHFLAGRVRVVDDAELLHAETPKVIGFWPGHEPGEVAERMAAVDPETELGGAELMTDHELPWVTCTPGGVTKGAALEAVAAARGIAREDVLAVGDGDNDRSMLRWAGLGVAMGQAPEHVRAEADETTGPVDQDGLAMVLERYC